MGVVILKRVWLYWNQNPSASQNQNYQPSCHSATSHHVPLHLSITCICHLSSSHHTSQIDATMTDISCKSAHDPITISHHAYISHHSASLSSFATFKPFGLFFSERFPYQLTKIVVIKKVFTISILSLQFLLTKTFSGFHYWIECLWSTINEQKF